MLSCYHVTGLIHANCAGEQDAQRGYQELLEVVDTSDGPTELKQRTLETIRNIAKDEMEHTLLLVNLAAEWGGLVSGSDEAKEAVGAIAQKVNG